MNSHAAPHGYNVTDVVLGYICIPIATRTREGPRDDNPMPLGLPMPTITVKPHTIPPKRGIYELTG